MSFVSKKLDINVLLWQVEYASEKARCSGLQILFRHCLLMAGIHARSVIPRMREMTSVDARHNFKFKGNLQSHKVNWGHIYMSVFIFLTK